MKFSKYNVLENLVEDKTYNGVIFDINKVKNSSHYDIRIKVDNGMISIWVKDDVTPEHPLFSVFDHYIKDETEAETFDEKTINGTKIEFTVKKITMQNPKGENVERIFFNKVTPVFSSDDTR